MKFLTVPSFVFFAIALSFNGWAQVYDEESFSEEQFFRNAEKRRMSSQKHSEMSQQEFLRALGIIREDSVYKLSDNCFYFKRYNPLDWVHPLDWISKYKTILGQIVIDEFALGYLAGISTQTFDTNSTEENRKIISQWLKQDIDKILLDHSNVLDRTRLAKAPQSTYVKDKFWDQMLIRLAMADAYDAYPEIFPWFNNFLMEEAYFLEPESLLEFGRSFDYGGYSIDFGWILKVQIISIIIHRRYGLALHYQDMPYDYKSYLIADFDGVKELYDVDNRSKKEFMSDANQRANDKGLFARHSLSSTPKEKWKSYRQSDKGEFVRTRYYAENNWIQWIEKYDSRNELLLKTSYHYDANQNLTAIEAYRDDALVGRIPMKDNFMDGEIMLVSKRTNTLERLFTVKRGFIENWNFEYFKLN